MKALYDNLADDYDAKNISQSGKLTVLDFSYQELIDQVGLVDGQTLVDLGCGTGTLALQWSQQGARVIGVDYSAGMLAQAKAKSDAEHVQWIQDDAQTLSKLDDDCCDIVTSCFALMDIPDLGAIYQSVRRVLRNDGRFVFAITHPCFQSPHADNLDNEGKFAGRVILHYAQEGLWKSKNSAGIRGQVGAHHRTASTYINQLINTGFTIRHVSEPPLATSTPESLHQEMMTRLPIMMLIDTQLSK